MTHSRDPRVIMYGVTADVTARAFLVGQLRFLIAAGWKVHLVSGEKELRDFAASEGGVQLHHVAMPREPSLTDPVALIRLWWLMCSVRPGTVVMGTPKMGVLGTLAAYLARVPNRIYLLHGYRAEGLRGVRGLLLRFLDRMACSLATLVVPVSESLRRKVISEGVVAADKAEVLGEGSANGVDLERFRVPGTSLVQEVRSSFGVPASAKVVAFAGRLTRDKGLRDLVALWSSLGEEHADYWLLVAGAEEPVDDDDRAAISELGKLPRVRRLGHTLDVERVYQASDVLLLLSKREGLGMVALEAAACGVPTVGFATTGVVDAVVSGRTGILTDPDDLRAVVDALCLLLEDEPLRLRMREETRRHACAYSQETVWTIWENTLSLLLADVGRVRKAGAGGRQ